MEGNNSNPIKISLVKDPIFREKHEPKINVGEMFFSEEQENIDNPKGESGERYFHLINKDTKEKTGGIYFDYPKEGDTDAVLRIRFSKVYSEYRGQDLGLKMYEKLLEDARQKKFDGIGSDAAVSSPAAAIWKKLMDKGYKINVNPSVEGKWREFVNTYNEGKMFKEMFSVNTKESAFKILFKEQEK